MSSLYDKESKGCQQVELLRRVPAFLLFDSGIWAGTDRNTSAIAINVIRCHVSVAMSTLNFVRELQKIESFDVASLFDDLFGMIIESGRIKSGRE